MCWFRAQSMGPVIPIQLYGKHYFTSVKSNIYEGTDVSRLCAVYQKEYKKSGSRFVTEQNHHAVFTAEIPPCWRVVVSVKPRLNGDTQWSPLKLCPTPSSSQKAVGDRLKDTLKIRDSIQSLPSWFSHLSSILLLLVPLFASYFHHYPSDATVQHPSRQILPSQATHESMQSNLSLFDLLFLTLSRAHIT